MTSRALLALVAAGALLTACGSSADTAAPATSSASAGSTTTLTVFAAASLTKTFTEIGTEFEQAHPGVHVTFSFAGSSDLATQITEGAPADVFASADEKNMAKVTDLTSGAPVDFATNVLEIATPAGNPAGIRGFADLAKPGVKVVVCAAQVPCGAATRTVEQKTGVTISPVSEESSVTDVLGKVTSGEADAGLVYVTDVAGAGEEVTGVEFPESSEAVNTYPIAALKGTRESDLAAEFVTFVTGAQGRSVLEDAGFGAPAT
ncbi:molybdate ABC transporter substrate-binding protein [Kineococcus rhizosphaerae]|uniref:Molybdate transport system substrate-binding protein n=1 Tax=Kineococcus rhizosphaerae TaxID=559628 RepID=A0A2T0R6L6_9ACTN|nr:molybdate ABC transporter substrate-binding protein [Kineococcus rhizosphaerae]PRY16807.1 molybdate transport system substrate-binding protein [Kineococcus rhizosphaerae]